jgi:YHS domain-containing protein
MTLTRFAVPVVTAILLVTLALHAANQTEKAPREALQPFNELIGSWRGTATPNGTKDEQMRNFWQETITWEWQFKDKDAWLAVAFDKSKHFLKGALRYDAKKDQFVLTLGTLAKQEKTFTGKLQDHVLTLDTEADAQGEVQRIVLSMLHDNRFLYRLDKRKVERTTYTNVFKVGATKEGVAFADGSTKNECVVSGGTGTMQVSYMGKTYYVCCSGCATEFRADPAKYVKDFEDKKAKTSKK